VGSLDSADRAESTVGARIKRFRLDRELTLSQLATDANVSKSYLWHLENQETSTRPPGETLYAVARALGVTMSDLLGRQLLSVPDPDIPESLAEFAVEANLPETDIQMLASIQFRGERPHSKERWRYIYDAIRISGQLDRPKAP
jgi:transcriptional regulator with XRE-family HTH domain